MSRSGKRLIEVPKGTEVKVEGQRVAVKGAKGALDLELPEGLTATLEADQLAVAAQREGTDMRRLHGLYRALVNNMVQGCGNGHEKKIDLIGVGFRAAVKGNDLELNLGFSHPCVMPIPEGLSVKVENNTAISIEGADARVVGQFAADVRAKRPPEPYKGKGARYRDEYVRRKAGKTGK